MATAPGTAAKKPRRSNGPAKPKPLYFMYSVVDAEGNAIPGAKLTNTEVLRDGNAFVDRVTEAIEAGANPPSFVRFFLPKSSRAKKDETAA